MPVVDPDLVRLVHLLPWGLRHRSYRAVPLRYWQSGNRAFDAVLPHLRATQKGNLARPPLP